MKRMLLYLLLLFLFSCNRQGVNSNERIVTVTIAPFKYFVEAIGGADFSVNVMVPPGASPHTYEPMPEQIVGLNKSLAYISDGYLGFELTWMDRFDEVNPGMKKLSLADNQNLIRSEASPEGAVGNDHEGVDPHFWISPVSARIIAGSIKNLLVELYPEHRDLYETNLKSVIETIDTIDLKAIESFKELPNRSFIIFHPALSYLARDYNLVQIPVEYEGKEPSPSQLKAIIDLGKSEEARFIIIQKEFDRKYADEIALEIGARVVVIDALSENWPESVLSIITALHDCMINNSN
jgi:zinc transport system substrate-binding protein